MFVASKNVFLSDIKSYRHGNIIIEFKNNKKKRYVNSKQS